VNREAELKSLNKTLDQLNKKVQRLTPGNAFLIINTTNNTFELYKNNEIIRQGRCSTGSFIHLEVDSTKSFTFETPKGVMTVQNKVTNPVWTKPDWAFIEEGLPVPPAGHSSRREANVLGDYALILGKGYMIHGTLYQRLIGSPVTHGCVRLLDDDLEAVYQALPIGSKVFIY
jgi:lipoprotein-anchoring transpeptidase ErfK/SrfK